MGVLVKVPPNTPVEWLHRMVITPKKDGSPRWTIDLSPLNKAFKRHTHRTRSLYHLATIIPKNVKKTTLDTWNGFHSVSLNEESTHHLLHRGECSGMACVPWVGWLL